MVRRAHKKSRNGCLECKRRHVKCDEKRPVCSNCIASERGCEYGPGRMPAPGRPPSESAPASTSPPTASPTTADGPVNILHIELMHNLYTNTYATFDPTKSLPWLPDLLTQAISTPYFANAILAFSALHMSTLHPQKQDFYHYHAAQLQTHALALFSESNPQVNQETCVPMFLFSSILGIHMLCDTLIYRNKDPNADFSAFLSRFTHYLRLHRGVRTIIGEAWSLLRDSLVKPVLDVGMALYRFDGEFNHPLANLLARIESAKLGPDLTGIYRQAIESLQVCMNVTDATDGVADARQHEQINGVIAWPVLVGVEFSDALECRRPEALVILAHYAVLLCRLRGSWLFGDSGEFMVRSTRAYLGEEWEEWLRWPMDAISSK
ncbi:hypothetical protein BDV18DRAFT_161379 [Aspergillus unguis]